MKDIKEITKAAVAAQIEGAMVKRGMTRKQFADAMGRTPSEVTRWLGGKHNFTIDLLSEISEKLGTQITGVVADGTTYVRGYGQNCTIGQIELPRECVLNLERRAVKRGESLGAYVKGILLRESARPAAKAADFCGIWKDIDMTDEELIADIKSHRSAHREIEEI